MIEPTAMLSATEASSFEEFFTKEQLILFRALVVVTRNPGEAEELTQEAFVKVWDRWHHVSSLDNPRAYLHRTAMNAFFDMRRRTRRFSRGIVDAVLDHDPLGAIEIRDSLERAILLLSPRQRAALVVVDLLGYDSTAAGAVLGIQPGTVRRLVSQARAGIRTQLAEEDRDG